MAMPITNAECQTDPNREPTYLLEELVKSQELCKAQWGAAREVKN
jgi:hypothetical protein